MTDVAFGRVLVVHARGVDIVPSDQYRPSLDHRLHLSHVDSAAVRGMVDLEDARLQLARIVSWHHSGLLDPSEIRHLLLTIWFRLRSTWGIEDVTTEDILALYREAGFLTNMPGTVRPSEPVTIYRGAHARSGAIGFSWTSDRACAAMHAARALAKHGAGVVAQTTIAPHCILGILDLGALVTEYVIDPSALRPDDIDLVSATDPEIQDLALEMRDRVFRAMRLSEQSRAHVADRTSTERIHASVDMSDYGVTLGAALPPEIRRFLGRRPEPEGA